MLQPERWLKGNKENFPQQLSRLHGAISSDNNTFYQQIPLDLESVHDVKDRSNNMISELRRTVPEAQPAPISVSYNTSLIIDLHNALHTYFSCPNIKRRKKAACRSVRPECMLMLPWKSSNFNFRRRSVKQKAVQKRLWQEEAVRHNAVS